ITHGFLSKAKTRTSSTCHSSFACCCCTSNHIKSCYFCFCLYKNQISFGCLCCIIFWHFTRWRDRITEEKSASCANCRLSQCRIPLHKHFLAHWSYLPIQKYLLQLQLHLL